MSSGWIRVERCMFEHDYLKGEPYTRTQAWLWLIANAVWKDTGHTVRGQYIQVARGSVFKTIRDLMEVWKWGNTKTSGFLKNLKKQDMIQCKLIGGKTLITIVNYEKYQDTQDTDKTAARQPQDTKETNKQINTTTLLGARESEIYDALGKNERFRANGSFLVLSEPLNWLNAGCDFDLDVLPILQSLSARNSNIKSWSYFSKAVFEARDRRLAEPQPSNIVTSIRSQIAPTAAAFSVADELRRVGQ